MILIINNMDTISIGFPVKGDLKITSESDAVKVAMKGLQKLVEFGALKGNIDDFLIKYEFQGTVNYAIVTIKKSALVDPTKLQSLGGFYYYKVDGKPEDFEINDKSFSVTTIQERMRIAGMEPKIKFRLTIQDYKKYWSSQKSKLAKSPALVKRLRNMFLVDLTGIFSEILPFIQEGKQLSALTGLNSITQNMNNISRDLSTAYRRALQQSKTGSLSKSVFTGLQQTYNEFVNALIPQVFPGIDEIMSSEQKEYSFTADGRIKLFS